VTQDCTQTPFASPTAAAAVTKKFEIATPNVSTYTAAASVQALFLNSNCWKTPANLPICTVTNTTATTAVFTIAKTTTGSLIGLDYVVSVTNTVSLASGWNQDFTVTCINKGDKATSTSTTPALSFTYKGCSTPGTLAAPTYGKGQSTLSKYNTGSTPQLLFNIVSTSATNALFTVEKGFCPDISCHLVGNVLKSIVMSFADNTITSTLNDLNFIPAEYQSVTAWCKAPKSPYYTIQKSQVVQSIFINPKTVATSLTAFKIQA